MVQCLCKKIHPNNRGKLFKLLGRVPKNEFIRFQHNSTALDCNRQKYIILYTFDTWTIVSRCQFHLPFKIHEILLWIFWSCRKILRYIYSHKPNPIYSITVDNLVSSNLFGLNLISPVYANKRKNMSISINFNSTWYGC